MYVVRHNINNNKDNNKDNNNNPEVAFYFLAVSGNHHTQKRQVQRD